MSTGRSYVIETLRRRVADLEDDQDDLGARIERMRTALEEHQIRHADLVIELAQHKDALAELEAAEEAA